MAGNPFFPVSVIFYSAWRISFPSLQEQWLDFALKNTKELEIGFETFFLKKNCHLLKPLNEYATV